MFAMEPLKKFLDLENRTKQQVTTCTIAQFIGIDQQNTFVFISNGCFHVRCCFFLNSTITPTPNLMKFSQNRFHS